jgi:quercetin dioxygenase-like cupin family protein
MQIIPRPPTAKNPSEQFTGDVWLDPIASPREDGQRMVVAKVRFAPAARTAWHSHAHGQTLHVTQGIAWVQSRGAPDSFMEHLAMLDNAEAPATTTTWLEHVTDDD